MFDVYVADSADGDLVPLTDDQRREVFRTLGRLDDRDLWDLSPLDWPRGEFGAWTLLLSGSWAFLCQFDKGVPVLREANVGRARLTVIRVKGREYAAALVRGAP